MNRLSYIYNKVSSGQFLYAYAVVALLLPCLLYTSPSPRDRARSRMPSSA